jgi:signal transduction histidine kinase/CheY-like chemotaxis protein/PAS domain-containing protein
MPPHDAKAVKAMSGTNLGGLIAAQREWLRLRAPYTQMVQSTLDSMSIGVMAYDDTLHLRLWNGFVREIFPALDTARCLGKPLAEVFATIAASFGDRCPDHKRSAFLEAAIRFHAGPPSRAELLLPDDRLLRLRSSVDGRGWRYVIYADFSELKLSQDRARAAELRLKEAIEALPLSFSITAADGSLELFNRQFVDEFSPLGDRIAVGRPIAELLSEFWDLTIARPSLDIPADDWPRVRGDDETKRQWVAKYARLLHTGSPIRDSSHNNRDFRVHSRALSDATIVRVAADISDLRAKEVEIKRLAESALAQRTEVLQEVLDTIPQAIAVVGPEQRVTFANNVLRTLCAPSTVGPEVEGSTLTAVFEALGLSKSVGPQFSAILSAAYETTTVTASNCPVHVRLAPISTGDTLLSITDLTAQRHQEQERLAQQKRVLQSEKSQAVVTLAGSIAHDFNNLLAVIFGFSSLASDSLKELSSPADTSQILRSIDNVIASAVRGRTIVESLNALTRERTAETQVMDLRDVITKAQQLVRVLFPSSIRFELRTAPEPCPSNINPIQIEQIVTNLCINAMHALGDKNGRIVVRVDTITVDGGRAARLRETDAGAKRLGTWVETMDDGTTSLFAGVLRGGRHARLTVADDGHGITEAVARNMFTPFFTTKDHNQGSGLGLSSVLEIVTAHAGGVHVRSQSGVGTTFMILLPEAESGTEHSASGRRDEQLAALADGTEIRPESRVLVVDDEEQLVELVIAVLTKIGYEVEGFADPRAAAARFLAAPDAFDLVITDQTMPELTGRELVERFRAVRPDLAVVICTGYSRDITSDGALPPGVKAVLRKPYTPAELANCVRAALAVL